MLKIQLYVVPAHTLRLYNELFCIMVQIYFKYEERTKQYVYTEQLAEYRMPLSLMLKFKKYLREQSEVQVANIRQWLSSLTEGELKKISILDKH